MLSSVGAWGWRHPEWLQDVFYPDDLPSDWQLSYYSNEFDLVVVPAAYWSAQGYGDEDWLDEVEEDFVFYIDWPFLQLLDQADYLKCAEACHQLGRQMAAVLVNNEVWQQLGSEQKDWFKAVSEDFTVLQYGANGIASYAFAADDQAQIRGENILLLHTDHSENLRDLSRRLTHLLSSSPTAHIVLANDGPEMQRLQELKTVMGLLAAPV